MSARPDFHLDVYQNEYLPEGGREVNAVVTVSAEAGSGPAVAAAPTVAAAEVIIVDCSGSMGFARDKMRAAKQAASVAVDTLRDGVLFAVVAGNHEATMVYPKGSQLVVANAQTKAFARGAIGGVQPGGGTAIGQWLTMANRLFAGHQNTIKHAILLTDGRNEHEQPADLDRAISQSEGQFVCDCRGVGAEWEVSELRRIASALLGSVDIVADPAGLVADFEAMTATAMGKAVADVALRLWTPQGATVKFVKQVSPSMADLTDRKVVSGPQSADYPTGSWGTESRDYHVCVEVNPAGVGDVMLAGRVSLVLAVPDGPGEVLGQGLVKATWTDDAVLSTRINPEVAHYTGQAELADVIQEGLEARKVGDLDTATAKLGRAVALATETGNTDTAKLLSKVVDVDDPVTGTVRLKSKVAEVDAMTLDTRSTKTSRVRKS